MRRPTILALVLAGIVALLDQASKLWVLDFFAARGQDGVVVLPIFNLVLVGNRGVSFGLFNGGQASGTLVFAALAVVIVALLLWWLVRAAGPRQRAALGLIIGGALGNVFDRLYRGAVVDFLDFHWGAWHWYAFNVADAAICVGVALIALDSLLGEKPRDG